MGDKQQSVALMNAALDDEKELAFQDRMRNLEKSADRNKSVCKLF